MRLLLRKLLARAVGVGYVPILVGAMAIMFGRTLLVARLLDVPEFGLFGVGMLVSNSFSMLGCLGFYLLLQRDLPMLIAKGRRMRGALIMHQTLWLAAASFVCLLPLSFLGLFSVSPTFFSISLLNGFAQQVFLVLTLHSRSEGRSMRFALDNLLRSIAVIAVIGLSGWLAGTASLMLFMEALITLVISMRNYSVIRRGNTTKSPALWVAAITSLPRVRWTTPLTLLATSVIGFAMLNGDRWFAASLLSRDDFALYAFAGIILLLTQSLQSVINVSVFTRLAQTYALVGKITAGRRAIQYSVIALMLSILLSAPAYFLVGYAIEMFFPKYVGARELLALFFVVAAFRVSDFLTSYLIIVGREQLLLVINVGVVLVSVQLWLAYFGFDLAEVRTISIVWLAVFVAAVNYTGCFLAVVYSTKSGQ